jgi:hypothetical protein
MNSDVKGLVHLFEEDIIMRYFAACRLTMTLLIR